MNHQQLRQIAREMRAELPTIGRAERVVDRTLIQLLARNGQIQLVIGHPDHYPCIEDAEAIAACFDVAPCTEPKTGITRIAAQDGRTIKVKSCAYAWREQVTT